LPFGNTPRECFIPRPGKVFLAGDFSGAELHSLAQVCKYKLGYSTLGDALLAGKDVHVLVAGKALGVDYEDALARYKAGDKEVKQARQDAKPVNFGMAGGMGAATFIKIRLKEGQFWSYEKTISLKKAWLGAFPEMTDYFEACKKELGPSESATVEFYHSKRLRKIRGFSTMCNGWFQALTADGAKLAIVEVIRRCYVEPRSALYGCRPVNFVHDELILEIPDDPTKWPAIVAEFSEVMANEFNKVVPDYPTKVDAVLMRRWSKAAEPTFDKLGNLIPWEC
jgi:DNA polymerase-1